MILITKHGTYFGTVITPLQIREFNHFWGFAIATGHIDTTGKEQRKSNACISKQHTKQSPHYFVK